MVFGVPITKNVDIGASSTNHFEGKGEAASTNNFTGTITVTVLHVLPNRNLLVSGEKQLAMTQGTEYIRFSGVVRPETVINNTVSSVQVADAKHRIQGQRLYRRGADDGLALALFPDGFAVLRSAASHRLPIAFSYACRLLGSLMAGMLRHCNRGAG